MFSQELDSGRSRSRSRSRPGGGGVPSLSSEEECKRASEQGGLPGLLRRILTQLRPFKTHKTLNFSLLSLFFFSSFFLSFLILSFSNKYILYKGFPLSLFYLQDKKRDERERERRERERMSVRPSYFSKRRGARSELNSKTSPSRVGAQTSTSTTTTHRQGKGHIKINQSTPVPAPACILSFVFRACLRQ